VIALAIGVGILAAGFWGVRMLARPVPHPDPDDVVEVAVDYRCSVCGLRLTVTQARGTEVAAPRHCREEMEPA
jgi:hypothetical protein